MRSSNAPFTEYGFSEVIRDVEYLFLLMTQLGTNDLNGQAPLTADQTVGDSGVSPSSSGASAIGFSAKNLGTIVLVNGAAAVQLPLATVQTDTQSGNIGDGTFVVPVDGIYQATGTATFTLNAAAGDIGLQAALLLAINGAVNYDYSESDTATPGANKIFFLPTTVGGCFQLKAGDTISLWARIAGALAFTAPSGAAYANLSVLGIPS